MRAVSALLAVFLLASPLLLAPAQGVTLSEAVCEGPACAAFATDGGVAAADACVEGAGCAAARACLRDVDCVALDACADAGPAAHQCAGVRNCADLDGSGVPQCALVPPCRDPETLMAANAVPLDCLPARPVLGWNACRGGAPEFTLRVFTGRAANGQGSSAGTWDSLWRSVAYPPADWAAPTLSGAAYSRGQNPIPGTWVSDSASSWINPFATTNYGPGGQYVFEARYLVPANAYGVTLSGRYAVDNNAVVSDTDSSLSTLLSTSALDAFSFWTPLPTVSLATGLHTLTVNANNRHAQSPVGTNVQATVHGYCKQTLGVDACTHGARSFRILLNTGLDPLGNPQANGFLDSRWTADGPAPAYSRGQDPLPGVWVTDPASSWISPLNSTATYAGLTLPAGYYGYEVAYTLPANAYNVWVNGKAAADNEGVLADTDAWQSTFVASIPGPTGFASWTSFSYPVTTLGAHVFSASVYNRGGPTGLNVVAEVTGLCRAIIDVDDPTEYLDGVLS